MMPFGSLERLLVLVPVFAFAISFHEYAHAWMADRLGDPGPRWAGRLTLNPLAHLDLVGTMMLLLLGIGFARPVVVEPSRFRNPVRDMMWVALAGPVANLLLACIAAFLVRAGAGLLGPFVIDVLARAVWLNVALALFNLLPIPPLDGSRIVRAFVGWRARLTLSRLEPYGFLLIIVLGYTGFLGRLVFRPALALTRILLS